LIVDGTDGNEKLSEGDFHCGIQRNGKINNLELKKIKVVKNENFGTGFKFHVSGGKRIPLKRKCYVTRTRSVLIE
jgi:hypothetical protein